MPCIATMSRSEHHQTSLADGCWVDNRRTHSSGQQEPAKSCWQPGSVSTSWLKHAAPLWRCNLHCKQAKSRCDTVIHCQFHQPSHTPGIVYNGLIVLQQARMHKHCRWLLATYTMSSLPGSNCICRIGWVPLLGLLRMKLCKLMSG